MTSPAGLGSAGLRETTESVAAMSLDQHHISCPTSENAHYTSTKGEPYYGRLFSLYHTLDAAVIQQLEQAIIYSSVRAFEEASGLFQTLPDELRYHPIVTVEHATMLWRKWSVSECCEILEDALEFGSRNASGINDHGIYTLLRIFLGKLYVFTKGDFTQARDSMREVRAWLIQRPVAEYTDLEVQCLVHYYFLMMCAVNVSDNFDVQFYRQIPRLQEDCTGPILSYLRERLQSKGRLRQAQAILSIETPYLDSLSAKKEACESLLKACLEDEISEGLWDIEGQVRMDSAGFWSLDGKTDAARQRYEDSRSAFERAPVHACQNKAFRQINLAKQKASKYTSASAEFKAWTETFLELSGSGDFYLVTTACTKAAEAALQVFEENRTDENGKMFWQWQTQAENLLESAGDLFYMYLGHINTEVAAFKIVSNFGAILQWHKDFHAKYERFKLWDLIITAKLTHQVIYATLDDQHNRNAFGNASEINDIFQEKKLFWEEETPTQSATIPGHVQDIEDETHLIPALKDKMPKTVWFSEWGTALSIAKVEGIHHSVIEAGTLKVKPWLATIDILLRWVRQGASKEQLSKEELETILNKESWDETVDVYHLLNQLTTKTFSSLLFGSPSAPTSCDHWSKCFSVLSDWLMKSKEHHEMKKQYLLLRLQRDRTSRLIVSQSSARDRMMDLQKLLELESTVHDEVQFLAGQNTSSWRNMIGSLKILIYQEDHGHVLWDEACSEFQEILSLYKASLKAEQERGRLSGQADALMLIAELFYFAAQRLRPEALDPFFRALEAAETAFQRMREGWKNLHGWERVDKILSASEERRSLRIYPLAMGVIREFPDTDQEVRSRELWSNIQAAKSIGLGWLMRVSKAKAPETMSSESSARYSDFQKFPNITVDDIRAITDDVGGDVVYVDWYRGSVEVNQMPCPMIATLSPGKPPQSFFLKMSWEVIDEVVAAWLKYEVSDLLSEDASSLLQQLSPLLEPLSEVSKPGQTLVFSATGDLHRVPLHAITVDGEVLIRRNPIVYTSSMTVLDVLFKARKSHEQHRIPANRSFRASLLGDPPTEAGSKALTSLSKKLSVKPNIRDDFIIGRFIDATRDPDLDLLHYHSHADFKDTAPTEQSLIFDNGNLSLPDVFDFAPTANSYHATLLGCGSGMTKTSVISGEVIGLVPAFLYAGAASTVSTLWPFDDRDAALYTRYFYEDVNRILKEGRNERVNLAKANQAAVLKIMDKKPELYHWAPFILNGFWMMNVCGAKDNANETS